MITMFGIPGIHHLITYSLILLIALSIFDTICLLSLNVRQGFKHTTTYTNACIDITFYHLYRTVLVYLNILQMKIMHRYIDKLNFIVFQTTILYGMKSIIASIENYHQGKLSF